MSQKASRQNTVKDAPYTLRTQALSHIPAEERNIPLPSFPLYGDTGGVVCGQYDRCAVSRRPDQALPAEGVQQRGELLQNVRPLR